MFRTHTRAFVDMLAYSVIKRFIDFHGLMKTLSIQLKASESRAVDLVFLT